MSLGLDVFREEDDQLEMKVEHSIFLAGFTFQRFVIIKNRIVAHTLHFSVSGHLPHRHWHCLCSCAKTLSFSKNGRGDGFCSAAALNQSLHCIRKVLERGIPCFQGSALFTRILECTFVACFYVHIA
jgi:hypothetical protein